MCTDSCIKIGEFLPPMVLLAICFPWGAFFKTFFLLAVTRQWTWIKLCLGTKKWCFLRSLLTSSLSCCYFLHLKSHFLNLPWQCASSKLAVNFLIKPQIMKKGKKCLKTQTLTHAWTEEDSKFSFNCNCKILAAYIYAYT